MHDTRCCPISPDWEPRGSRGFLLQAWTIASCGHMERVWSPWLSWCHSCPPPPPPAAPVWLHMEAVWTRSNELVCAWMKRKSVPQYVFKLSQNSKGPILDKNHVRRPGVIRNHRIVSTYICIAFPASFSTFGSGYKKKKFWLYVWRPSYQRLQTFKCSEI